MFKKMLFTTSSEKGQTMLIVVLVIVIALTVGLSVASRSITNVKIATQDANSQKALAAAEAGIELMLQELTTAGSQEIDGSFSEANSNYITTASSLEGDYEILLAGGNEIEKDIGIDLWFVDHNEDDKTPDYSDPWNGSIEIYWGKDDTDGCTDAALEVVILSGDIDDPTLKRYALDPCSTRISDNDFDEYDEVQITSTSGISVGGISFTHNTSDIAITNGLFARIIPLYTNSKIAIKDTDGDANNDLPSQGSVINSVGNSGDTEREIIVFQGYPSLPVEYFPNNFFYYR